MFCRRRSVQKAKVDQGVAAGGTVTVAWCFGVAGVSSILKEKGKLGEIVYSHLVWTCYTEMIFLGRQDTTYLTSPVALCPCVVLYLEDNLSMYVIANDVDDK